ncbi:uncharacterized protein [Choristoneura fumiferana]|uniref:uncharacterized protein n=1 Tax=Choristoneura fumiferana TaxID=7141 RepID=UPI003D153711
MKFLAVFAALVAISAAAPTTSWTLNDLSQAIQSPATPAAVLPYLEHALNQMMDAIFAGHQVDSIAIPTPAGLLPVEAVSPVVVMPAEVDLTPVAPAPVPAPVVPAPVVTAPVADAASPLVQIIVNIKSQESAVIPEAVQEPQPVPAPVVVPEPVVVVEHPEAVYEPQPLPAPTPIEIGPAPAPVVVPEPVVIAPEPVVVAPEVPAPIVIAPAPIEIPNPIDVIAVGAPDFNPIDLLQPVPVNVAGPMI